MMCACLATSPLACTLIIKRLDQVSKRFPVAGLAYHNPMWSYCHCLHDIDSHFFGVVCRWVCEQGEKLHLTAHALQRLIPHATRSCQSCLGNLIQQHSCCSVSENLFIEVADVQFVKGKPEKVYVSHQAIQNWCVVGRRTPPTM